MKIKTISIAFLAVFQLIIFSCHTNNEELESKKIIGLEKHEDYVIYEDSLYYSSFPSVVETKEGKFLLSFRRAPNRKLLGEQGYTHVDNNSYLVSMESEDGKNWTKPNVFYAHDFGGSQDPCLITLESGKMICASYGWSQLRSGETVNEPISQSGDFIFQGGYYVTSDDNGVSWSEAKYPPAINSERRHDQFGNKLPAYNRGSMYQGKNGDVYWIAATGTSNGQSENNLLISTDEGETWVQKGVVAKSDSITFNEASVYETPKGDIIGFIRTANYGDTAVIARSVDGGETFDWEPMGFKGHPFQATRLPDDKVLLVYGYRHEPYGIRAKILNSECTDFATAEEIIIREDGGTTDIGYPWAVILNDDQVLISYYYNKDDGVRFIGGSIMNLIKE